MLCMRTTCENHIPFTRTYRAGLQASNWFFRVYIAKITFTTLIDHFTSLYAVGALVYSYQLIKLELLTQSIRQQKLPPHRGIRHSTRLSVWPWLRKSGAVGISCFGKTLFFQLRRFILARISRPVNGKKDFFPNFAGIPEIAARYASSERMASISAVVGRDSMAPFFCTQSQPAILP